MAIEDKVDLEMEIDRSENDGRKKKRVLSVIVKHGIDRPFDEISDEISEALGHQSFARAYEWHRRLVAEIRSLSIKERRKLHWTGSNEVTDLAVFRQSRNRLT